jgi:uncharacterized protein (DUF1697 family)
LTQFVALLRGINVGGKNLIKMADLAACFQALGFTDVRTYIQSGNVIFREEGADYPQLTRLLEEVLSKAFQYNASLVLRSEAEMQAVVSHAPEGFGNDPTTFRYDVIFLKEPLTASEAMQSVTVKEGVDQAFAGKGVLYFSRLISKASQSHLTRLISLPIYQNLTIRNWNTTTRLLKMMEAGV